MRMITSARIVKLLPDTSAARQKSCWFLDQSSLPVLGLDVRGHPESAHKALYQFNGWMTHDLVDTREGP